MKIIQIFIALLFVQFAIGQTTTGPYLVVHTKDAQMPLLASEAKVDISGTIAQVHIKQAYHNTGNQTIEGKYVFPMSTQAAVHNMTMTIGDRTIKAKVFEKDKAEKVYQEAVANGKRAAKMDQHRPNVFSMKVGNILPSDIIVMDIYYTELLVPENGKYQFVYPGVVGPRYTGESTAKEETFTIGYAPKITPPPTVYDLKVNIEAGMIIQDVNCITHDIDVKYPTTHRAEITLPTSNETANRDFILEYTLKGKEIQTGLLLYEGEEENFFTFLVEPPTQTPLEKVPSREYLFVVDVSGSMNGFPLNVSKKLMRHLLCNLKDTDAFNILLFAAGSTTFQPQSVEVSDKTIANAIRFMSSAGAGGGTNLLSALKKAYSMPRNEITNAKSIVIITDGYISVEKEAFEIIEQNLHKASIFPFGIGSSVNRYLIEGMSKVAKTASFIATSQTEAQTVAASFQDYIVSPVLTQLQLKAEGFEIYDIAPKSIPDVFASRPILVYGKWKGKPTGTLTLTGYQGDGMFKKNVKVAEGTLSNENESLKYLWARKKIELLDDYKNHFRSDTKQAVIDLGLTYNLATPYTSFVAVDSEVVTNGNQPKQVNQPLPLPQQVENSAVGAEAAVTGKSKATPSFKIVFHNSTLDKSKERAIKMWLKVKGKQTIAELLKEAEAIRWDFDEKGELVTVQVLKNGRWERTDAYTFRLPSHLVSGQVFSITIQ